MPMDDVVKFMMAKGTKTAARHPSVVLTMAVPTDMEIDFMNTICLYLCGNMTWWN